MRLKSNLRTAQRQRSRRRARDLSAVDLDQLAVETLRLIATTFLRCGYAPRQLSARFKSFLKNPPPSPRPGHINRITLHDPGHVLTLWASDPDYVDAHGMPRPLAVRGPAPSIDALVRRVRPKLRLEDALYYLLKTHAVRRIGRKYIPTGEFVRHAPDSTQSAHHLLVLYQLVRNFEFNAQVRPGDVSWPQRVAECPDFPAHELPAFIDAFKLRMSRFLQTEDKTMARIALKADSKAKRVRPTINLCLSVTDPSRTRKIPRNVSR